MYISASRDCSNEVMYAYYESRTA